MFRYFYVRGRIPWLIVETLCPRFRRCQSCPCFRDLWPASSPWSPTAAWWSTTESGTAGSLPSIPEQNWSPMDLLLFWNKIGHPQFSSKIGILQFTNTIESPMNFFNFHPQLVHVPHSNFHPKFLKSPPTTLPSISIQNMYFTYAYVRNFSIE